MTIALTSVSSISGTLTTTRDGGDATFRVDEGIQTNVVNGTAIGQANAVYIDDFNIAASGTLNIDLAGTLTDPHGNVLVFTAIKEIFVKADPANVNNVVVGNGATPFLGPMGAAAHTVAVKPGGFYHVSEGYSAAGWAVGAGASDNLMLTNSAGGTAVIGTIVVVGEV